MELEPEWIKQFLTSIGDPNRLQILFVLHESRLNVGEIASQFSKLSRPAISHHLKVMKDAKVVKSEKVGQEVFYWTDKEYLVEGLRDLADYLEAQLARRQ